MIPPSASGDGENLDVVRTTVAEPALIPGEGQLLQDITSLQSQLSAVNRRQDELMQLVGVLRERRGSVEPAIPAGETGGEPSTSNCGRLHPPEQPPNLLPNNCPVPGQPVTQPRIHPLAPPNRPFPVLPPNIPVFGPLHNRAGHVVGLVHQGSFSVSDRAGPGATVNRLPPPMFPQMRPQVYPQMPPQVIPQMQPQVHPQMPPQSITSGPMQMNWGALPGPPPPYQVPGSNQPSPSTVLRGDSRTGTSPVPRPRSSRANPNDGSEDDSGSDVLPVPERERTSSGTARANPPRKARPKDLSGLE